MTGFKRWIFCAVSAAVLLGSVPILCARHPVPSQASDRPALPCPSPYLV